MNRYNPDRAAFIAAIMLCEAETAMKTEVGRKAEDWRKVHQAGMRLFHSYDRNIDKNEIYDIVNRVLDDFNESIQRHTGG